MARTIEMWYQVSRKVNDGNFGSAEFVVGEKIAVDPCDDPAKEYDELCSRVWERMILDLRNHGIDP